MENEIFFGDLEEEDLLALRKVEVGTYSYYRQIFKDKNGDLMDSFINHQLNELLDKESNQERELTINQIKTLFFFFHENKDKFDKFIEKV